MFEKFISKIREIYFGNSKFLDGVDGILMFLNERYEEFGMKYEIAVDIDALLAFKPDLETVQAALLVEPYKSDFVSDVDILNLFGTNVFEVVNNVVRICSLNYEENNTTIQVDVLKKMFLTMAKDLRVILVLLVYRLYIMENLNVLPKNERVAKALETLNLYVPIADRLGVYRIKMSLEDLSFRYAFENDYDETISQLNKFSKSRDRMILLIKRKLEDFLKEKKIDVEISGRVKSSYSIYKKLQKKGLNTVNDIFDIFAMRLIVADSNDESELYKILGMIHSQWTPLPGKFKDYVSNPKPNGYRSLHTIVLGLTDNGESQAVEVQIRTRLMHQEAEYGMASHWLYKKLGSDTSSKVVNFHAQWLRGLRDLTLNTGSEFDLMKKVELDIFRDRIFVLTPRGEVKDLPKGSTPIDFAYSIHTDLGNRCYMAKVNSEVRPLGHLLSTGDLVEIVTRADSSPKLEWLSIVKTSLAKTNIKSWHTGLNRDQNIRKGKELLNKNLKKFLKTPLDQNYSILKDFCGNTLTINERETLLEEIGKGSQIASDILRKIFPEMVVKKKKEKSGISDLVKTDSVSKLLIGGASFLPFKFPKCCNPVKGDDVIAYVTRGNFVSVHKQNCKTLLKLNFERFIQADFLD